MCQSPNSSLVRRTIDLNYANKQRAAALRWLIINGALLALLSYDLCVWCSGCGRGSLAGCAEAAAACLLLASCAQHARTLAPAQRRLLGLAPSDLDSSSIAPRSPAAAAAERSGAGAGAGADAGADREEPGSLSPRRSWRTPGSPPSPPHSSHSPHSPHSPSSPAGRAGGRVSPDEFISDGRALAAYIRQQAALEGAGGAGGAGGARVLPPPPPRPHQVAVLPERSSKESGEEEVPGGGGGAGVGAGAPLWRRLHVDPQRLTEYNLNMRLWLHVTVVSRVARELETAGPGATNDALLPFLRPFADKQYVADRIKELSRGGCLSAYRWDGGGGEGGGAGGWSAPRPADADLLMHLFQTYLDLLTGGAFSARHVAGAGGVGAGGAETLVLRRARALPRQPPHYVLQVGEETLDVGAGRDNLLHTLLLFLAAAARGDAGGAGGGGAQPSLCRLHLGPASLNMLWILGR